MFHVKQAENEQKMGLSKLFFLTIPFSLNDVGSLVESLFILFW